MPTLDDMCSRLIRDTWPKWDPATWGVEVHSVTDARLMRTAAVPDLGQQQAANLLLQQAIESQAAADAPVGASVQLAPGTACVPVSFLLTQRDRIASLEAQLATLRAELDALRADREFGAHPATQAPAKPGIPARALRFGV